MIKGSKEELDDIVRNYVCKDDGGNLVVTWHGGEDSYVLRCGKNHFPEEVTRIKSRTQQFKAGELEPVGEGLNLLPRTDLATGNPLDPATVQALINYARKYELDAYRGHVVLMYGKPYFTIDGYLYHAHQLNVPYSLGSRPLNKDEREAYMIAEGDHAWQATATKLLSGSTFSGLGVVTKAEMEAKSPRDNAKLRSPVVAAHPWQLAQKRAEWQALRRAFPIGETKGEANEGGDGSPVPA